MILRSSHLIFGAIYFLSALLGANLRGQAGKEYDGIRPVLADVASESSLRAELIIHEDAAPIPFDRRLLGVAYSWSTTEEYFGDEKLAQQVVMKFQGMRLPLNRIGGAEGQAFKWKYAVGPFDQRKPQKIEPWQNKAAVMRVGPLEWVKAVRAIDPDATFVIALNILKDSPSDHADLARLLVGSERSVSGKREHWATLRKSVGLDAPVKVALWELGNENDWRGQKEPMSPEEYVKRCKEAIAAIRSIDPAARFAAHAATAPHNQTTPRSHPGGWQVWHRAVLAELGTSIDYLVFHPYYNVGGIAEQTKFLAEIRADIRAITGSDRIKLFLSEHANWPRDIGNRDTWSDTHSLRGSLLTTQMLLAQMEHPGTIASYWAFNAGPWAMIYEKSGGGVYTTGILDVYRILNAKLGDAIVLTTLTGSRTSLGAKDTSLAVRVTSKNGRLQVVIVNLEPSATRLLTLKSINRYVIERITQLSGNSLDSYNGPANDAVSVEVEQGTLPANDFLVPARSLLVLELVPTIAQQ